MNNYTEIETFHSPTTNQDIIRILWGRPEGYGEYTLWRTAHDEWHADSECMDTNEDKSFLRSLLEEFINQVKVDG